MNSKLKLAIKIFSNTLVVIVVILAFLLHGFRLFGLTPYSVLSGSMESVYPTGSLIYVAKTDPAKLKIHDIITFRMSNGTIATHRIIELVPDENDPETIRFRTKGDENEIADGALVACNRVIGKPVFGVPGLGYLATYMMQPPGKYVALTVAAVLVLLEVILGILLDEKDKPETQAEEAPKTEPEPEAEEGSETETPAESRPETEAN